MSLYSVKNPMKKDSIRKEKALPKKAKICMKIRQCIRKSYKETPRCPRLLAMFTLEAAVILPLLAAFFVSILFFFRVMQVELEVQKALNDTGRKLAVYLCDVTDASVVEMAAAKASFLKEMNGRDVAEHYITGGRMGISLLGSDFSGNEIVLNACYQIRLPIKIFRNWDFFMVQHADCRKWNGWNGSGETENADEWVYITPTGTVYHTINTCTHLVLSIRSVEYAQIGMLRSENGERYERCLLCAKGDKAAGRIYITNQGNRYHTDLNCSGITRTVFMIRLSEAGGRRPCSRCGGGE